MTVPPDVYFANYAFKAAPANAQQRARTMPDRLNDIINVKDWGAVGDGLTDDTSKIQAAIDYAYLKVSSAGHGSIVFFPAGTYNIGTPPLRASPPRITGGLMGVQLVGAGRDITILKGTYSTGQTPQVNPGFLVVSLYVGQDIFAARGIHGLTIWNESTDPLSGAVYYQAGGRQEGISDCRLIGNQALFFTENTFGGYVRDCLAQSTVAVASANNTTVASGAALSGSIGFAVDQGVMTNCRAVGFDIGFALVGAQFSSGNATFVNGCKAIQCNKGFSLSLGAFHPMGANSGGVQLLSNHAERCSIGLAVGFGGTTGSCLIAANVISGDDGPSIAASIQGMSWASGTVTVTTTVAHNIGSDQNIVINASPASWTPDGSGNQMVSCHVINATQFSYTGVVGSPPAFSYGTWNYPCRVGISAQQVTTATFIGNSIRARFSGADQGFRWSDPDAKFGPGEKSRIVTLCHDVPGGWTFFDGALGNSAGELTFVQCSGPSFAPFAKYAGLAPDQSWKVGNEINIVDGQKSGGGPATFGDVVQGGSTNHYKVRANGTNWIRIG